MPKLSKKKCSHPRSFRHYQHPNSYYCDLCGQENLPAPEAAKIIPEGIYELTEPVANPYGKDGRSNAWNVQPEIEEGTYFVKNGWYGDGPARGMEIKRYIGGGYERIEHQHPAYDAVIEALKPIEGSDDEFIDYMDWKKSYEGAADVVLAKLLKAGKITRQDIIDAANTETPED